MGKYIFLPRAKMQRCKGAKNGKFFERMTTALETLSKLVHTVTPAKAGVQGPFKTWIPAKNMPE
jgi:hypothetical protein